MSTSFRLITGPELDAFAAALRANGWAEHDFEMQEDVYDPREAEVETATGQVGVRCLRTEAVQVYRLGPGFAWADDFAADLAQGKFGAPASG